MTLWAHEDITKAMEDRRVIVPSHRGIQEASIDLAIENLLDTKSKQKITIPPTGLIIKPGDTYHWELPEMFLAAGIEGMVTTRSRFGRLGTWVQSDKSPDNPLYVKDKDRLFTPICKLSTFETYVKLRPNEVVGQLYLGHDLLASCNVWSLIDSGDLIIQDNSGRSLSSKKVKFHDKN